MAEKISLATALTRTGLLNKDDKKVVEMKALTDQDRIDLARDIEREFPEYEIVKQDGSHYF